MGAGALGVCGMKGHCGCTCTGGRLYERSLWVHVHWGEVMVYTEVLRSRALFHACVPTYSTFDIAKVVLLNSVLCPKWPQV